MAEEESNAGQQVLALLEALPDRPDVLDAIAARPIDTSPAPRQRHTGARFFEKLCADAGLAERVWTGLRLGLSINLLARRLGVSTNTLGAARRLMTERHELEPVRRRVDALLDEVAEEGLEYWRDGMRSGVIHPGQIPIPTLAAISNKDQREAGVVPGTGRSEEEHALARVRAAAELLGLVEPAAAKTDAPSGERPQNGPIIDVTSTLDTAQDTSRPPSGPAADLVPAAPAAPSSLAAAPAAGQPAGEGGGGVSTPPRPSRTDGLPQQNSGPKDLPSSPCT